MNEVEKLREALRWYEEKVAECRKIGSLGDNARQALDRDGGFRARDAISKQAEPTDAFTAVDMATAAAQGFRYGQVAVEPAPAQDEQQPVGWYTEDHLTDKSATTYDREVADRWRGKGWPVYELYARPAQTEQPVNVPEGWLIELGFDVLDRSSRCVESKSHIPTIKVILPPCEPVGSPAWDLRDEIARRIGSVLAAPIAQTAPQPTPDGCMSWDDPDSYGPS